jgi:hypothetical protein
VTKTLRANDGRACNGALNDAAGTVNAGIRAHSFGHLIKMPARLR